jgi:hypothetical protein
VIGDAVKIKRIATDEDDANIDDGKDQNVNALGA